MYSLNRYRCWVICNSITKALKIIAFQPSKTSLKLDTGVSYYWNEFWFMWFGPRLNSIKPIWLGLPTALEQTGKRSHWLDGYAELASSVLWLYIYILFKGISQLYTICCLILAIWIICSKADCSVIRWLPGYCTIDIPVYSIMNVKVHVYKIQGYCNKAVSSPALLLHLICTLTHCPLGDFNKNNFQANFSDWWLWYQSGIALRWTSHDLSDDKSTLVQVMAWCRQATSHYLN